MPTATMPISETLRTMLVRLNSVRKVLVVSEKNDEQEDADERDRDVALGEQPRGAASAAARALVGSELAARQRGARASSP